MFCLIAVFYETMTQRGLSLTMACQQFLAFPAVGYTCTLMYLLYHNLPSDESVSHKHPILVEQVVVTTMACVTIASIEPLKDTLNFCFSVLMIQ